MSIAPGTLKLKDPDAIKIAAFNWDGYLDAGVEVVSPQILVTGDDTALVADLVMPANNNRQVNYRLAGGTLGGRYGVTCRIVTNGSPAQTDERSFFVLVQNL